MTMTIRSVLRSAAAQFSSLSESNPQLDAEVLLCHALQCTRSHLLAWPEQMLQPDQYAAFERLAARRSAGEPIAHIVGAREFWSLSLMVTPDTLIPRPETELLVEQALARMSETTGTVADLGTGSGAVALALANERPMWRVVATDHESAPLQVARANAGRLGIRNIEFAEGDWCTALGDRTFDMIISNPPYIAELDPHLRMGDLRFEPTTALAAGTDGLDAIRCLIRCSRKHLRDKGWLLFEHGFEQGALCRELLAEWGYREVVTYRDLENRERVSGGIGPCSGNS